MASNSAMISMNFLWFHYDLFMPIEIEYFLMEVWGRSG